MAKTVILLPLTFVLLLGLMQPAWASKIYRCKDNSGRVVFQQTACDEGRIAGNSQAHQVWRQLRVISAKGRDNLSTLQGEVESIAACERNMKRFQGELDNLRGQVVQLSRKHLYIGRAFGSLEECGVCRSSAISNCTLADQYLDKALAKLNEY